MNYSMENHCAETNRCSQSSNGVDRRIRMSIVQNPVTKRRKVKCPNPGCGSFIRYNPTRSIHQVCVCGTPFETADIEEIKIWQVITLIEHDPRRSQR